MLGDVAGELLDVELTRREHQVVDRLLRLDAHHDRGVAELQVEVEQQRLPSLLRESGGEVRGDRRLPRAALRREDRDHATLLAAAWPSSPAAWRVPPCGS